MFFMNIFLGKRLCVIILLMISFCGDGVNGNSKIDPYRILCVSKTSSQEMIRQKYRELCLKYHPDKNGHKSKEEREKCEEIFKQIQTSYSQIGTPAARKQYDAIASSPFYSNHNSNNEMYTSSNKYYASSYMDDLLRSMMMNGYGRRNNNNRSFTFTVNGVDMSHLFSTNGRSNNNNHNNWFYDEMSNPTTKTSSHHPLPTFVQSVSVSLSDLYKGVDHMEFRYTKKGGWINQWKAAYRGGLIRPMLLQSCISALPILIRTLSWKTSIFIFCITMIMQLPRQEPNKTKIFTSSIQPGWKAGTKVKFDDKQYRVEFILKEKSHPNYHRIDNDLFTEVQISSKQAKNGCTISLPSLIQDSDKISLTISPNTKHNQIIIIPNKGWPIRNNNQLSKTNGDIQVQIQITRKKKKRLSKSRRKNKQKD